MLSSYLKPPIYIPLSLLLLSLLQFTRSSNSKLIIPIFLTLGSLLYSLSSSVNKLPDQRDATIAIEVGRSNLCEIRAIELPDGQWRRLRERAVISSREDLSHQYVIVKGDIRQIKDRGNGYRRSMERKGYTTTIYINQVISTPVESTAARRANNWALERLERLTLSPESFATVASMTLSRKELISSELKASYSKSGTAHLMALSGLHLVTLIYLINIITLAIPLFRRGVIIRTIISIIIIWLFAMITGMGESIQRAAIMLTIIHLSRLNSQIYFSTRALYASAIIILCLDPTAIFNLSYQLSFAAVTSITMLSVPLIALTIRKNQLFGNIIKSVIISIVATIFTSPLTSHYFGTLSPISPITTLLVMPLFTTIILTAGIWIILPIAALAPLFSHILNFCTTLQNQIVTIMATQKYSSLEYQMGWFEVIICYTFMISMIIIINKFRPDAQHL